MPKLQMSVLLLALVPVWRSEHWYLQQKCYEKRESSDNVEQRGAVLLCSLHLDELLGNEGEGQCAARL
jgi:hypothetical protein